MTYMHFSLLAIIAAAFVATWTPMVSAQTTPPQQAPGATQTFPEDKLKSYAVAALQVQQIQKSYKPQLQGAQSAQERSAIDGQAMQKQVEAVRQQGLTVKEYNDITAATQTDGAVASKVQALMDQAQ